MQSIRHLQESLESLIGCCCGHLRQASQRQLVFVLLSILLAGSVVPRRVARTARSVWDSPTHASSHERRLRRIRHNADITWEQTYSRAVRRILKRPRTGPWVVIIDESGHTDRQRVLLVSVWYRGRAVPLAWISWPGQTPQDISYWTRCDQVLTLAAQVLGDDVPVVVLGDRAFGCPAFTDLVTARGWDWLVRLQGQTRFQDAQGRIVACRDLLPAAGGFWVGCGALFKKEGWRPARVAAYWRNGCREALLLGSSCPAQRKLIPLYRKRSAIEALFRDWKGYGWHWEDSQVRRGASHDHLMLLLAWVTLLTLCLGEEAATQLLQQPPQQGARRPWHARDSLFQLGRDRLWTRLWRNDQTPIVWELARADALSWMQEAWQQAAPQQRARHVEGGRVQIERVRRSA